MLENVFCRRLPTLVLTLIFLGISEDVYRERCTHTSNTLAPDDAAAIAAVHRTERNFGVETDLLRIVVSKTHPTCL